MWHPSKLAKQIDYHIQNASISISHTNYTKFKGSKRSKRSVLEHFYAKSGNMLPTLYYKNPIATLTVILKREIFQNVNLFNTDLLIGEDHELWIRIANAGYSFGYINEKLANYRLNEKGASRLSGKFKRNFKKFTQLRLNLAGPRYRRMILANQYRFLGVSYFNAGNYLLAKKYFLKSVSYSRLNFLSAYIFYFLLKIFFRNNVRNLRSN